MKRKIAITALLLSSVMTAQAGRIEDLNKQIKGLEAQRQYLQIRWEAQRDLLNDAVMQLQRKIAAEKAKEKKPKKKPAAKEEKR